MISSFFSRITILVFGTLFPAYYSYKAVRTKNVKEYVKWMMYWIVFAFFTCIETVTDVFLAFWFPFYYEIKILVVLWLLSPATRGSSVLYRQFVHPWLTRREEDIDDCIAKAKQQGYSTVVEFGTKGVNYATNIIMQTAIKGGGGLVSQLKRSYSASDVGEEADVNRNIKALANQAYDQHDHMAVDEAEVQYSEPLNESVTRPRGHSMGRSVRASKVRSADMSDFLDASEVVPQRRSPRTHDMSRGPRTPPFLELQPEEPRPRRDKSKKTPTRTKSFTIGDTRATTEALFELHKRSSLTSIPEFSRRYSTLPRRSTRSFRSTFDL